MSVINFYLGLIATAIAVRYLPLSFLSLGSKGALYRGYTGKKARKGGRHEKGRATGAAAPPLYYTLALSIPCLS